MSVLIPLWGWVAWSLLRARPVPIWAVLAPPFIMVLIGLIVTLGLQFVATDAAAMATQKGVAVDVMQTWGRSFHPLIAAQFVALHLLSLSALAAGLPFVAGDEVDTQRLTLVSYAAQTLCLAALLTAGVWLAHIARATVLPLTAAGVGVVLVRRAPVDQAQLRWIAVAAMVGVAAVLISLDITVEPVVYSEFWGLVRQQSSVGKLVYGASVPWPQDHLGWGRGVVDLSWLRALVPALTAVFLVLGLRMTDFSAWNTALTGSIWFGGFALLLGAGASIKSPPLAERSMLADVDALPISWAGVDPERAIRGRVLDSATVVLDGDGLELTRPRFLEWRAAKSESGVEWSAFVLRVEEDVALAALAPLLRDAERPIFLELPTGRWVRLRSANASKQPTGHRRCKAEFPGAWPAGGARDCPYINVVRLTGVGQTAGGVTERLSKADAEHVFLVELDVDAPPYGAFQMWERP